MQEDMVDTFLRYGLFLGAVFQLICIGAVIVMPDVADPPPDPANNLRINGNANHHQESDSEEVQTSDQESPQVSPTRQPRLTKRDKKKRR